MRRPALISLALASTLAACGGSSDDDPFSGLGAGASGSAGSGTAGSGKAGSTTAGSGTSGSGVAGSGIAGSGTSGSGTSGSGTAGDGAGGTGVAGMGPGGPGGAPPFGGKGGAPPVGGAGGAGGGGFTPPTTCASAHGFPGCCSPAGDTVYWWENGMIQSKKCTAGQLCVWKTGSSGTQLYDCSAATTPMPDPAGKYPYACGGEPVPGACP